MVHELSSNVIFGTKTFMYHYIFYESLGIMTWVSCCENLLKSDLGGRIFDSIKSDCSDDRGGAMAMEIRWWWWADGTVVVVSVLAY